MEKKPWYASKTLWMNTLAVAAAAFDPAGILGHVLAPDEVATGLGIANILLRLVTNKGLVS